MRTSILRIDWIFKKNIDTLVWHINFMKKVKIEPCCKLFCENWNQLMDIINLWYPPNDGWYLVPSQHWLWPTLVIMLPSKCCYGENYFIDIFIYFDENPSKMACCGSKFLAFKTLWLIEIWIRKTCLTKEFWYENYYTMLHIHK